VETGIHRMEHIVNITPDAQEDIHFFKAYERRIIASGIRTFLTRDALVETNRRKPLEPNQLGSWELCIDHYRVFYDVEDDIVYVTAVGYKEHNDLYIRGRKVNI
jgi:mRNA-degrading endonuclease RelE of RelBE toxin-antitoxin system